MNRKPFVAALSLILLLSPMLASTASAHWEFHDQNGQYLFGYTGVESAYEYDQEVKNSGIKTNVTTLSSDYNSILGGSIMHHNDFGNKVGIFLDTILFQEATPSWYLRPDFKTLFDKWLQKNSLYLTPNRVAFLIINSEANNRGLTNAALNQATAYVKQKLPLIPTVVGYGLSPGSVSIANQTLPSEPDGFAFWDYYVLHPEAQNSPFRAWLNYFKSHIDQSRQRLIFVFDAHYATAHLSAGILQDDVGEMAKRYADIALSEPLVVGMVGFTWTSFGDILGLRDMTQGARILNAQASCKLLPCP